MEIPFEDNTLDAAYAIEATVHAPTFESVYGEIFRVLKPGAKFGCYEWCMTDDYNEEDSEHRRIAHGIEVCIIIVCLEFVGDKENMKRGKNEGWEVLCE